MELPLPPLTRWLFSCTCRLSQSPSSLAAHSWHWRHSGFEGVRVAKKVAFAFVFDERAESAAVDVGRLCELDVRGTPIYAQAGEGDRRREGVR